MSYSSSSSYLPNIIRSRVQKFPAWHTKTAPNGKFCEGYIVPYMVRLMYQLKSVCWNKGRLCWKIAKLFYFCHLKKLVRPETFWTLPRRCICFAGSPESTSRRSCNYFYFRSCRNWFRMSARRQNMLTRFPRLATGHSGTRRDCAANEAYDRCLPRPF